jgi:hypothetical protein
MGRVRCLAALVASLSLAAPAGATQTAKLGAAFTPYRLGGRTTIVFSFQIAAPAGELPAALTDVDIEYPQNLGIVLSGLGLEVCSAAILEANGTGGCPTNSIMGGGSAVAEMRFGAQLVAERARISIARAPDEGGHIALLLYAVGPSPVDTQILSPAQLVPAGGPFGGQLNIELPLVPSVPGAPDVAIVRMQATIGPRGVLYEERVGANTLTYAPKGILLPNACPKGGFQFAARFEFVDGTRQSARTAIPCPHGTKRALR